MIQLANAFVLKKIFFFNWQLNWQTRRAWQSCNLFFLLLHLILGAVLLKHDLNQLLNTFEICIMWANSTWHQCLRKSTSRRLHATWMRLKKVRTQSFWPPPLSASPIVIQSVSPIRFWIHFSLRETKRLAQLAWTRWLARNISLAACSVIVAAWTHAVCMGVLKHLCTRNISLNAKFDYEQASVK